MYISQLGHGVLNICNSLRARTSPVNSYAVLLTRRSSALRNRSKIPGQIIQVARHKGALRDNKNPVILLLDTKRYWVDRKSVVAVLLVL
jgi:hypothetical protein